jgi:outer membrane protein OmpA-like peptidoglycan-associated protein
MNQELSEARARAVRAFLIEHGLNARNVRSVGRGEHEPLANNDTPEGRANNRRVEIIIRDQQAPEQRPEP